MASKISANEFKFTGGGTPNTTEQILKFTSGNNGLAINANATFQTGLLPIVQKALQEALYAKNTKNVLALATIVCNAKAAAGLITFPANYAKTPYTGRDKNGYELHAGTRHPTIIALENAIVFNVKAGNVPLAVKYITDLCGVKIALGMVPTLFQNGVFKPPRVASSGSTTSTTTGGTTSTIDDLTKKDRGGKTIKNFDTGTGSKVLQVDLSKTKKTILSLFCFSS